MEDAACIDTGYCGLHLAQLFLVSVRTHTRPTCSHKATCLSFDTNHCADALNFVLSVHRIRGEQKQQKAQCKGTQFVIRTPEFPRVDAFSLHGMHGVATVASLLSTLLPTPRSAELLRLLTALCHLI
ncbi:hypothetical protein GQ600_26932 [Phytophthora cactorum]|nr:hypothetical protein GQ600_26932 [Phytophthora cactorum]